MTTALVIDAHKQKAQATAQMLRACMGPQLTVALAHGIDDSLGYLNRQGVPDIVLLDTPLPDCVALDLLTDILRRDPFAAVIVTASAGDDSTAVAAMKRGAMDYYVRRNFSAAGIERAVLNAMERSQMARRIDDQQHSLRSFAHVLVHDLRGPLRSIRGGIMMLVEDLPKDMREEHAEMLGFVQDGADRMDRLIVALYRFCSIDDAALSVAKVDLTRMVRDLRETLRADLRDRGAELSAAADLPGVVADVAQLSQLLQNLIANGIKYNTAPAPRVHLSATEDPTGWRVEVSDNGIGIEPQYLEEVFQPFRRLHAASEYSGSGLGLATCRRIAERHGGRLTCRSTVGQGSVFVLQLPRTAARSGQTTGAAFPLARGIAADASR